MKNSPAYKENSKDKLKALTKKRMDTIMIGALASIEKHFGHLWGETEEEQTEKQKLMEDIYESLRTEILDKGNDQVRRFNQELDNFDVSFVGYQYVFLAEKRN